MTKKKILIILGSLALLVVLVIGATFLIPADRIGAIAVAHAEEALDREVRVENFSIRLLPRPAVALQGVTISRSARPGTTASASEPSSEPSSAASSAASSQASDERLLMSVDRIDLRPRLLPLLRRNVIVDEVLLDRPRVFLEIDEGGTLDLPTFESDEDAEPATGDSEIQIQRFLIRNGSLVYSDANTGADVTLAGIEQQLRLRGSVDDGALALLALRGELSIADIDADLPEYFAFPVRDIGLRLEHDAELNQADDRLDLGQLRLTLQEVPLDVEGTIHALSNPEARQLSLRAGAENIDIARLIASLPPGLLAGLPQGSGGDPLRGTAGLASIAMTISGRAGGEAVPDVDGTLQLDDVALSYGPYAPSGSAGNVVGGLDGVITFSMDSVSTPGLTGRLLGEPFELAFNVHDLAEPQGSVALSGAFDLGEANRLGLFPEGMRGSGRVALDVSARGGAAQPADAEVDGSVQMAGVEMQLPEVLQPIRIDDGEVRFAGLDASAQALRATMGESDVTLDFRATNWMGLALGDRARPGTVDFDARSTLFDADALLGYDPDKATYGELLFAHLANRPLDDHGGLTAPQLAEEMGLSLPVIPDVRADGRIRADRVVSGALTYDEVEATLLTRDGDLEIRPASFRMMGGRVNIVARLGAGSGLPAGEAETSTRPFSVEYSVNEVTAEPFLDRFTAFRGHLDGTMMMAGYARMELEENMLPERESVGSEGNLAFVNGALQNWPLVQELGSRISAAGFDTLAFRDWSGRFRVAGARVLLEESLLEAGDIAILAAGSFDVAGNLNIEATLHLPQGLAANIPGAPAGLLAAVSGEDGRIPVGARIGGTARQPSISLDLSQAGAAAASAAREAAEAEARVQGERLADELGIELPATDSLSAAADSARQRVQDDVQNRLRRLLRPPGGGGDGGDGSSSGDAGGDGNGAGG